MKIEQEVGGSKPNQDQYVGPERQLTVDTDNWDIRLHDGVTPGGHPILSRDNNDERYQGKSEELDGLDFTPERRGFLARLGAGLYRIRTLVVNTQQLTIENADGYGGNPTIGLADRIETDHTFGGDIAIEGVLQVDGGINADTSGTHYGPVVGDVTGDVTGNLTGNATGNHSGSFTGNVDVRGKTVQFDSGQIPLAALDGLLAYIKRNSEEYGVIKIWSGAELDVPAGYQICNGLNGTPDLRDKFVIGAGGLAHPVGDFGGSTSHSHTSEMAAAGGFTAAITVAAHILTVDELPAHNHLNGVVDKNDNLYNHGGAPAVPTKGDSIDGNSSSGTREGYTTSTGGGLGHSHGATADTVPNHTHGLTIEAANHLPPYYALCYIMRIPTLDDED